jgi:ABC-type antimicrobial peptide transport system permease subunit
MHQLQSNKAFMIDLSSPDVVVAVSSLISIICTKIGSLYVSRLAARKDTIQELRDKIIAQE